MFETLTDRFNDVFHKLRGRGKITEENLTKERNKRLNAATQKAKRGREDAGEGQEQTAPPRPRSLRRFDAAAETPAAPPAPGPEADEGWAW